MNADKHRWGRKDGDRRRVRWRPEAGVGRMEEEKEKKLTSPNSSGLLSSSLRFPFLLFIDIIVKA
jgi:hypothetical protein